MTLNDWLGEDNKIGIDIFNEKYRYENETFEEWLDRISGNNDKVRDLIAKKKFLFGGRILANRGLYKKGVKTTYSNCYVTEAPEDNIEAIFDAAKRLARTYSYGGGVGIDISKLAPEGATVRNAAKKSSGAVSFMDLYSLTTGLIAQNGRRGALMISMDCSHPDIEKFIDIKKDLNKVTKANISVRMNDKFMKAAKEGKDYTLKFKREETGEVIEKKVNAKDVLMHLAKNNWEMGEPGCLFWNRISKYNLLEKYKDFSYAGTNPCGEEPLPAGGSCLLGAMNISAYVVNDTFSWSEFEDDVMTAVDALNEVLDEGLPLHPLKEQRDSVRAWRQIGLGQMGLADALIKLKIRYGSKDAIEFCDMIGTVMINAAMSESSKLAKEKGSFDKCRCNDILSSSFFKKVNYEPEYDLATKISKCGLRNSQLLTIAPTGTISTMLGISGGIEPIFRNSYTRKTETLKGKDEYYKVYTPIVKEFMEKNGIKNEEDLPEYFVTADKISYMQRVDMQAVCQKYIDASISSTVNLPETATVEDIFDLYIYAWEKGCKGITVFRDNCFRKGILTTKEEMSDLTNIPEEEKRGYIHPTSDNLIGLKRLITSGCGSLHVEGFFTKDTGDLREIFLSKGSTGGCNSFMVGLSRMISISARGGIPFETIIDQLKSTLVCPSYISRQITKHDVSRGSSCPSAIGYALESMKKEIDELLHGKSFDAGEKEVVYDIHFEENVSDKESCPKCGSKDLTHTNGCVTCKECGWSKCS